MNKLKMIAMCLLAMIATGLNVKAQEVTITLTPGWTWISCPGTEAQDFETALGSFTPQAGDMIKSQWGNATFRSDGHWRGNISQFYPGYGYKYYSTRMMPVTVTFNVQQPAPQVMVTTMEPTEITTNSATCGGNIASVSGDYVSITLRGICWSTHPNPTFNDNFIEEGNGLGSFTILLTELAPNTTYYVRACVVTPNEMIFGNQQSFTTEQIPNYTVTVSYNPTNGGTAIGDGTYEQGQSCTVQAIANTGYAFSNWTENDYVVSTNANYTFTVTCDRTLMANFIYSGSGNAPNGAIDGLFSVSENQHVYFSQGNLQYQASTNIWRFAVNQYDYIGNANSQISPFYSGWIDLFGWSTSGYNHGANCYQPWSTSTNYGDYYAYGNYQYNLYDQTDKADWGYNPISNGGNTTHLWRTLTQPEWNYVFNNRATISGIRYAKANVNGMNGVILLPDDWSSSTYSLCNTNSSDAPFNSNTLSDSQWITLEQAGAVFLPAAGVRNGTSMYNVDSYGYYWSASYSNSLSSYFVFLNDSYLYMDGDFNRSYGLSVRLVYNAE